MFSHLTPNTSDSALAGIMQITEPASGIHRIASQLKAGTRKNPISDVLADLGSYKIDGHDLANLFVASDRDVAKFFRAFSGTPDSAIVALKNSFTTLQEGFRSVAALKRPSMVANPFVADPKDKVKLMDRLIEQNVNSGDWRVFSEETWTKARDTLLTSEHDLTHVNTQRGGFLWATRKTTDATADRQVSGVATSTVTKPVETAVPHTNLMAPEVSAQHIRENPGNYMVVDKNGRLHQSNSKDPSSWFSIVRQENKTR